MNEKETLEHEVIEALTNIEKYISQMRVWVTLWGILTILGICVFLFNFMNLGVIFEP